MKKIKTKFKEAKAFNLVILFPKTLIAGTTAFTLCDEVEAPQLEKLLTHLFVEFMVDDMEFDGEKFKLYRYEKW